MVKKEMQEKETGHLIRYRFVNKKKGICSTIVFGSRN